MTHVARLVAFGLSHIDIFTPSNDTICVEVCIRTPSNRVAHRFCTGEMQVVLVERQGKATG